MKRVGRRAPTASDPWAHLREFTSARIALGRAGSSLPTRALLEFQLAHARARDAVHRVLDVDDFAARLAAEGLSCLTVHSAAADRDTFIARPDLGRVLDEASAARLDAWREQNGARDVALIVADGLSATAVESRAPELLRHVVGQLGALPCTLAPIVVAGQGRVALSDEIGQRLGARIAAIVLGERPGLSSPDSLGIYLTYAPRPGRSNAERNCISNVRPPEGLSYEVAAHRLRHLANEAMRRGLSGVSLKDEAPLLAGIDAPSRVAWRGDAPGD